MLTSTKIPSDEELSMILARLVMLDDALLSRILSIACREQSFLFDEDCRLLQSWACFIRALRCASLDCLEKMSSEK